MGQAEIISLDEIRARKQYDARRQDLHRRFDQWLDKLEAQLQNPEPTLTEVTETVWSLRQDLTGDWTETIVAHAHHDEQARTQANCSRCEALLTARPAVSRTVETMVGPVQLERPYFYCRVCRCGVCPFDEVLG